MIQATATHKITTLTRRRPTRTKTIVMGIAAVILLPFFTAAMVGCAEAATSTKAPHTATYNDGWIDASQNMIDQYKISRQGVDNCLADDKTGGALISCIDAIHSAPKPKNASQCAGVMQKAMKDCDHMATEPAASWTNSDGSKGYQPAGIYEIPECRSQYTDFAELDACFTAPMPK